MDRFLRLGRAAVQRVTAHGRGACRAPCRVRDTGSVANGGTGILTAGTTGVATPEDARRAWPQWLALGIGMIAVAVVSVFWDAGGARLLLGALGLFLAVRGALLLRGARSGAIGRALAARAGSLGTGAL